MIRVVFSVEDLSRVRVVGPVDTNQEAAFALESWGRNTGGYFRVWHHEVANDVRRRSGLQQRLRRFTESGAASRALVGTQAGTATKSRTGASDDSPGRSGGLSRKDFELLLGEFTQVAVLPYRKAIQTRLACDIDAYRQIMSASGVETLLRSLHPRIHWRAPVLEIEDNDVEQDIELGGRGLRVCPSLFLCRPGTLLPIATTRTADHAPPTLVFPVRPDPRTSVALGSHADAGPQNGAPEDALAMLMGRTRAALLEELLNGCSNGDLAHRVGVSAAAVSQHTSVLRAAGLIATRRTRNLVLHTVTPLGRSLLGSPGRNDDTRHCGARPGPGRTAGNRTVTTDTDSRVSGPT